MYTLTLCLLGLFSLYIAAFGFVRWDASFLREGDLPIVQILIILVAVIFLFYGLKLLYKLADQLASPSAKKIRIGLFLFILAGQMAFLLYFRPALRYDALKTFDQAVEMLTTHTISGTYETGYFARYTNNYPITILTYWLLSSASMLGLSANNYMLFVQLINVGLLDISFFLASALIERIKDEKASTFFWLLCAVCPTSYVWVGFFYTSTLSMPFFLGILLLFFHIMQEKPQNTAFPSKMVLRSVVLGFLLGLCVVTGYKARATAFIAWIAFCITALYQVPWKNLHTWFISQRKTLITFVLSFLVSCVLLLGLWSAAVSNYVDFDYKNTGFPTIHWVMMGMRWDGAYDVSDELYTFSFPTKEEKVAADKELLMERIQEAGPGGLLSLMGRKLLNTWVDGTDTYEAENSAFLYGRSYGKIYEYLLGNKDGLIVIYSQAFRVLQMLIIGAASLILLYQHLRQRQVPGLSYILRLAFLGGMAFHIIWETNPLYSLSFAIPGLALMASDFGVSFFHRREKGPVFCSIAFPVLLILLILGNKQLVETPIEENLYRARQYQYAGEIRSYVQEYDEVYAQTFVTDQPFNRLSILAENPVGEYNQSAFVVEIEDENGTLVYYNDRFLSGRVVNNRWYEFEFDPVVPTAPTLYTIRIFPGYIHDEDSLSFLTYATGNEDMYRDGELTIAGEVQKNSDLCFAIYEYQVTTYFNQKVYLLLCGMLLIICGGITVVTWKTFRRK